MLESASVSWVKPGVVNAVPVALPALIGGLNGRHAQAAALDKLGLFVGFRTVMNGLNKREKTAGQHQKDDGDGHGESLSLLNVLCVFVLTSYGHLVIALPPGRPISRAWRVCAVPYH